MEATETPIDPTATSPAPAPARRRTRKPAPIAAVAQDSTTLADQQGAAGENAITAPATTDPALARLVNAWPTLPTAARLAVDAVVMALTGAGANHRPPADELPGLSDTALKVRDYLQKQPPGRLVKTGEIVGAMARNYGRVLHPTTLRRRVFPQLRPHGLVKERRSYRMN